MNLYKSNANDSCNGAIALTQYIHTSQIIIKYNDPKNHHNHNNHHTKMSYNSYIPPGYGVYPYPGQHLQDGRMVSDVARQNPYGGNNVNGLRDYGGNRPIDGTLRYGATGNNIAWGKQYPGPAARNAQGTGAGLGTMEPRNWLAR